MEIDVEDLEKLLRKIREQEQTIEILYRLIEQQNKLTELFRDVEEIKSSTKHRK